MSGPGLLIMKRKTNEESQKIGKEVIETANCAYEKAFPDCKLIEKFNEWLDATKPIACNVISKAGRDKDQKDADSLTTDFVEVPDYQTQIKAADIITDIRGLRKRKIDVKHSLDQSLMAVAVQVLGKKKS